MKPKIYVVNGQDEVIGVKDRDEIDFQKDIYRVSALWLTNEKGEVLIVQRAFTKKKDPGLWGPAVAGTVDEGESYDDNITKETIEEIGISNLEFTKGPKFRVTTPQNYFCQWYISVADKQIDEFAFEKAEVHEAKWVSAAELADDIAENSDKYTTSMSEVIVALGKQSDREVKR